MANGASLLTGRNNTPLTPEDVRRAINTFLGLDGAVQVRYEETMRTVFRVSLDEHGHEFGEILLGADIYPGPGVVDPNAALSLDAACAHELTHYHRWKDKIALGENALEHIDEALTSLQAALRYDQQLSSQDVRQLISDAIQRLQLHLQQGAEVEPEP